MTANHKINILNNNKTQYRKLKLVPIVMKILSDIKSLAGSKKLSESNLGYETSTTFLREGAAAAITIPAMLAPTPLIAII